MPGAGDLRESYPVLDADGRLLGMLDAATISRSLEGGSGGALLSALGLRPRGHAYPDQTLDSVLIKLGKFGVSELPVVSRHDARELLGVIGLKEVAATLAQGEGEES